MNRVEAMQIVAQARGEAAAITGPGTNSGLLYENADSPATIYNMDLAYAAPIALGMALARPDRRIMSIEGEGSFYAGSTVLSTIWRQRPSNLTVVVLDNGVWGTSDGTEPTATSFGVDLIDMARANGWEEAHLHHAETPSDLATALEAAAVGDGPHFVVAKTDTSMDQPSSGARPRPKRHLLDCAVLMRAELSGDR